MDACLALGDASSVLEHTLNLFAHEIGKSLDEIHALVSATYRPPTVTAEDVENRNYTFVSFYPKCFAIMPIRHKFLVSSTSKKTAIAQAEWYIRNVLEFTDEIVWDREWPDKSNAHLYPRNYVREARELFAAGKHV